MNCRKLTLILLTWLFLFGLANSIGNQGRGNNALYTYYGITF